MKTVHINLDKFQAFYLQATLEENLKSFIIANNDPGVKKHVENVRELIWLISDAVKVADELEEEDPISS